jgi:hypothetical protein
MTASKQPPTSAPGASQPVSVDDLFEGVEPVRSADDLARTGVFEDGEVEQFLDDLYAMRHADTA